MKNTNNTLAALQINQVIEQLNSLADYELIAIHNDYCEANNDSSNHIIVNDDETIDSMFDIPSEAMRAARLGDYNHSHNYFILDGYTDLVSFNYATDDNSPIVISELAQWLINEDKLADYDITVTTLDDMLASIEDNISDDNVMLNKLGNYLMVDLDNDSYEDNVYDVMVELNNYTYEQIQETITMLGINYQ